MLYPELIDISYYQKLFEFTLKSEEDEKEDEIGVFVEPTLNASKAERRLSEGNGFTIEVTDHEAKYIDFKFNFEAPANISTGLFLDSMSLNVLEPSIFISKKSLKRLKLIQGAE